MGIAIVAVSRPLDTQAIVLKGGGAQRLNIHHERIKNVFLEENA